MLSANRVGSDAVRLVEKHRPDIVLLELSLQGLDGLEAMLAMKEKVPSVKIIVLTSWDEDSDVVSAVSVGADGFCNMENSNNMIEAIRVVLSGRKWIEPKLRNHEPVRRILLHQDPTFGSSESIGSNQLQSQNGQESRFDC
jgi:DNA-binding NarL/FixJ family response regulator